MEAAAARTVSETPEKQVPPEEPVVPVEQVPELAKALVVKAGDENAF